MGLSPLRVPTQDSDRKRNKRHQRTSIILHGIPKYTDLICSSFWEGFSKHFCQVNIYFLLALVTWKHESGVVPLALDPIEVAHRWA